MNPLADQLAVGAIILGALAFFAVRFFRSRRRGSCGSDCGCSAPKIKR